MSKRSLDKPLSVSSHPQYDRVLGIDPGLSGAITLLVRGRIEKSLRMPTSKLEGSTVRVDPVCLSSCLKELAPDVVILERPLFYGDNHATSTGVTGINWGIVYACIQLQRIPIVEVYPNTWTALVHGMDKACMSIEDPKEKTQLVFKRMYPTHTFPKDIVKNKASLGGAMDAAMIAFWYCYDKGLLKIYAKNM